MRENMPTVETAAVGVPIMFGRLFTIAIPGMLRSIAISFFFITIVLMATFKSIRIGLFSMLPNIWPILVVFGAIGLFQIPVNMSVAIVGMITLGIAVDDTVHYLTKYLHGRHLGHDQEKSILYAFRQVGAPLVFTSVILIFGFGALTQSDFVVNSDMALYCTLVIALALFADFILLPVTILKFEKKSGLNKKENLKEQAA
jgi:predicted RND superfamily exporter protein